MDGSWRGRQNQKKFFKIGEIIACLPAKRNNAVEQEKHERITRAMSLHRQKGIESST